MKSKRPTLFACAIVGTLSVLSVSQAATIVNADTEKRNITITEDGVRSEVELVPNVSLRVCEAGCFLLFPSGLMLPIKGTENLEIRNNNGVIVSQ